MEVAAGDAGDVAEFVIAISGGDDPADFTSGGGPTAVGRVTPSKIPGRLQRFLDG
ncbi:MULTISPECIES: hypothetical protein [Natrialbaceae]|uniref:hypothetical protein n=1 Tax=Natrialbaceae TaxID=1644061 RepID=UPI00207D5FA3|nr:hypothetical protein [Natronococcus sp. CG52]